VAENASIKVVIPDSTHLIISEKKPNAGHFISLQERIPFFNLI